MCGIAGYWGDPEKNIVEKMTRSLVHRGPDDEGYFINDQVALGMRRLKIIDLAGGKQPMRSADGGVAVVFNGEIYNFILLRRELEKLGVTFKTNSDTEVIVEGYRQYGTEVFKKFDGMFAIAIWDDKKKQLVLARDRFGEKPLYYGNFGSTFIFGSELKAVLAHPKVAKKINLQALHKYFIYEYVPAPLSIWENIYKLEPGNFLVHKNGSIQIQKYFFLELYEQPINEDHALELLEQELEKAVTSRLLADVPLGLFLSGGIDSSTLAFFAQKNSPRKIKTFSIGFEDKSFDESQYARAIAEHLHTDHHEQVFSNRDVLQVIPEIFSVLDEPMADASILPTYLLSRFTRDHVTVALAGDGADELLAGYPTFQARRLMPFYDALPKSVANYLIDRLPTSFNNITWDYALKRIALSSSYPSLYRDIIWIHAFAPHQLSQLFSIQFQSTIKQNLMSEVECYLGEVEGQKDFNKLLYLYQKLYLPDDILVKSDRASMMTSLETRAPFLANSLSSFLNSLPLEYKIKGFSGKYLLKKLMAKYLPKQTVGRKKKGFGVPMAKWLAGDLQTLMNELLDPVKIKRDGFFNLDYIQQLKSRHLSKKQDNRKQLWALMVWQLWLERWK